jgi:hypothetical protein
MHDRLFTWSYFLGGEHGEDRKPKRLAAGNWIFRFIPVHFFLKKKKKNKKKKKSKKKKKK